MSLCGESASGWPTINPYSGLVWQEKTRNEYNSAWLQSLLKYKFWVQAQFSLVSVEFTSWQIQCIYCKAVWCIPVNKLCWLSKVKLSPIYQWQLWRKPFTLLLIIVHEFFILATFQFLFSFPTDLWNYYFTALCPQALYLSTHRKQPHNCKIF